MNMNIKLSMWIELNNYSNIFEYSLHRLGNQRHLQGSGLQHRRRRSWRWSYQKRAATAFDLDAEIEKPGHPSWKPLSKWRLGRFYQRVHLQLAPRSTSWLTRETLGHYFNELWLARQLWTRRRHWRFHSEINCDAIFRRWPECRLLRVIRWPIPSPGTLGRHPVRLFRGRSRTIDGVEICPWWMHV